jgi:iron complex transport system substrate-binding protein
VRVLYYSAVGYTAGSGTLVDEKIRLAGGRNVAAEAGLIGVKNVGLDVLVGMDPDVIVVPRWTADADGPVGDIMNDPAWRDVAAVRTGHVFAMTAAALTSESPDGVRGVEELARRLHPEAFSS